MSSALLRQPSGLAVICAVEFCERFAGFLVSSLMVLYLSDKWQLSNGSATQAAGYWQALCYLAAIAGGWLADRIGYRRAVLSGLCALVIGLALLTLELRVGIAVASILLIVGNGLFKPSVTALLSALYVSDEPRRSSGFGWFYLTVNLAGFAAPVIGGLLRTSFGWASAFLSATAAALLGLLVLCVGSCFASAQPTPIHAATPPSKLDSHRPHQLALLGVLLALSMLGLAFSQSAGTLLIWARDHTRRNICSFQIPPDLFASVPSLIVILLTPVLSAVWRWMQRHNREPSDPLKLRIGLLLMAAGYGVMALAAFISDDHPVSALWLLGGKLGLTIGEMLVLPSGLALAATTVPSHRAGFTLGLSFAAQALGFWLGGLAGNYWDRTTPTSYFAALTTGALVAAGLCWFLVQRRVAGRA